MGPIRAADLDPELSRSNTPLFRFENVTLSSAGVEFRIRLGNSAHGASTHKGEPKESGRQQEKKKNTKTKQQKKTKKKNKKKKKKIFFFVFFFSRPPPPSASALPWGALAP